MSGHAGTASYGGSKRVVIEDFKRPGKEWEPDVDCNGWGVAHGDETDADGERVYRRWTYTSTEGSEACHGCCGESCISPCTCDEVGHMDVGPSETTEPEVPVREPGWGMNTWGVSGSMTRVHVSHPRWDGWTGPRSFAVCGAFGGYTQPGGFDTEGGDSNLQCWPWWGWAAEGTNWPNWAGVHSIQGPYGTWPYNGPPFVDAIYGSSIGGHRRLAGLSWGSSTWSDGRNGDGDNNYGMCVVSVEVTLTVTVSGATSWDILGNGVLIPGLCGSASEAGSYVMGPATVETPDGTLEISLGSLDSIPTDENGIVLVDSETLTATAMASIDIGDIVMVPTYSECPAQPPLPKPEPIYTNMYMRQTIPLPLGHTSAQFRFLYGALDPAANATYSLDFKVGTQTLYVDFEEGVGTWQCAGSNGSWPGDAEQWLVIRWDWTSEGGTISLGAGDIDDDLDVLVEDLNPLSSTSDPEFMVHIQRAAESLDCWGLDATDLVVDMEAEEVAITGGHGN